MRIEQSRYQPENWLLSYAALLAIGHLSTVPCLGYAPFNTFRGDFPIMTSV